MVRGLLRKQRSQLLGRQQSSNKPASPTSVTAGSFGEHGYVEAQYGCCEDDHYESSRSLSPESMSTPLQCVDWMEQLTMDLWGATSDGCDVTHNCATAMPCTVVSKVPYMDKPDHGESKSRSVSGMNTVLPSRNSLTAKESALVKPTPSRNGKHYEFLHDRFLESLLLEQMMMVSDIGSSLSSATESTVDPVRCQSPSTSSVSLQSSFGTDSRSSTTQNNNLEAPRKRLRPADVKVCNHNPYLSSDVSIGSESLATVFSVPPPPPISDTSGLFAPNGSLEPEHKVTTGKSRRRDSGSFVAVNMVELAALQGTAMCNSSDFLHPKCRLQKDKGKGAPIDSVICAVGSEQCLDKLRPKMLLLTQFAVGADGTPQERSVTSRPSTPQPFLSHSIPSISPSRSSRDPPLLVPSVSASLPSPSTAKSTLGRPSPRATMRRRRARSSEYAKDYIETRSVIELRMGFLSMQYGILLRWDTVVTGAISLVVLRKTCSDSFYPSQSAETPSHNGLQSSTSSDLPTPSLLDGVVGDRHAILQRDDRMEISLMEPPFHIPQPWALTSGKSRVPPAFLRVSVPFIIGLPYETRNLSPRWILQLVYQNSVEEMSLQWDAGTECFIPVKFRSASEAGSLASFCYPVPPDWQQCYTTNSFTPRPTPKKLAASSKSASLSLEVRLLSKGNRRIQNLPQRNRLTSSPILVASSRVSLADLRPQPRNGGQVKRINIHIGQHDCAPGETDISSAVIGMELLFESEYAFWVQQELNARRRQDERNTMDTTRSNSDGDCSDGGSREHIKGTCYDWFTWKQVRSNDSIEEYEENRDEKNDSWDWICGVC
jgi:hypothetical protein